MCDRGMLKDMKPSGIFQSCLAVISRRESRTAPPPPPRATAVLFPLSHVPLDCRAESNFDVCVPFTRGWTVPGCISAPTKSRFPLISGIVRSGTVAALCARRHNYPAQTDKERMRVAGDRGSHRWVWCNGGRGGLSVIRCALGDGAITTVTHSPRVR